MDFSLDRTTLDLRDLCRSFAAEEIAPYAADWTEQHRFPSEVFTKMGRLGLMGLLVPEEYGGRTPVSLPM